MISINLNIKESAYDKIIYFLSHLKDDVTIVSNHTNSNKLLKSKKEIKISKRLSTLDRLVAQSDNKVMLTRDIATDTSEMINDIS